MQIKCCEKLVERLTQDLTNWELRKCLYRESWRDDILQNTTFSTAQNYISNMTLYTLQEPVYLLIHIGTFWRQVLLVNFLCPSQAEERCQPFQLHADICKQPMYIPKPGPLLLSHYIAEFS